MSKYLDDPRLTAYALNELPADLAKEFEMEIKNDLEAQKEVEEIRKTATLLSAELEKEKSERFEAPKIERIYNYGEEKSFLKKVIAGLGIGAPVLAGLVLVFINVKNVEKEVLTQKAEPTSADKVSSVGYKKYDAAPPKPAEKKEVVRFKGDFKLNKQVAEGRAVKAKRSRPNTLGSLSIAGSAGAPSSAVMMEMDEEMTIAPHPMPGEPTDKLRSERYDAKKENPFKEVKNAPLSTFSVDVDTASYANMRRFITRGKLPPVDSVRVEEFINYFSYDYPAPKDLDVPFSANMELTQSPWHEGYKLARIGLKGFEIGRSERPASNLVFLLDVSGSMNTPNKLPLLKQSLNLLLANLDARDRVAIAVYAGASGLVLPSTPASDKATIMHAFNNLKAGGSTNGAAGIKLAYEVARKNFIKGGVNRVILATDGDFNVGVTSQSELLDLVKKGSEGDVFLTILGLGMGNYNDSTLEKISNSGNGSYHYIDTLNEANKVLGNDMNATLITIAKDVKIQVEFNPQKVKAYRLIGYENRLMAAQDFNNDKKDAGEIGAGHTVTALYEIVPIGAKFDNPKVDKLKYQQVNPSQKATSDEMLTVKLRWKKPTAKKSTKVEFVLNDNDKTFAQASEDTRFAAGVASFAMVLRKDKHIGNFSIENALSITRNATGKDLFHYRKELIQLMDKAKFLK